MKLLTVCTLLAGIFMAITGRLAGRMAWFTNEQVVFFHFTSALLLVTALTFYLLNEWYKRAKES